MNPNNINYFEVKIPENKSPKKFTFTERRAEILQLIMEAGHPGNIHQTKLAERYGVTQGQISQDISAIRKNFNKQSKEDIEFITEIVYQKCIKSLLKEKKYLDASKVIESWNKWLFNTGKLDKAPEKIQMVEDNYSYLKKIYDDTVKRKSGKTAGKGNKGKKH